ncbi:MAG: hypothetical protein Q9M37_07295 [Desulfonauticus sp.]|nr:hypothetical protein [Desulfonauticus sp.]
MKSEILFRAIVLGASIGLIASWFGFNPARSLALGVISGLAAGLTRVVIEKRKKDKQVDKPSKK